MAKKPERAKNQTMDAFKITHQRTGFLSVPSHQPVRILCIPCFLISARYPMRLKNMTACDWKFIHGCFIKKNRAKTFEDLPWWSINGAKQSNTNLTVMSTVIRNGVLQKANETVRNRKTSELWWQQGNYRLVHSKCWQKWLWKVRNSKNHYIAHFIHRKPLA